MNHIMRFCFGSPRRILTTIVVLAVFGAIPNLGVYLANGAMNLLAPFLVPVGLLLIVLYGFRTMFGGFGGGRRRR